MPTLTLTMTYDGSDPEITQALSRMVAALGNSPTVPSAPLPPQTQTTSHPPTILNNIATNFAALLAGTPRLVTVMKTWLGVNGKALLTDLVKVSGVQKQHDYSGIGSALTRNLQKAGWPKKGPKFYTVHKQPNGDRVYEIAGELVEPLKRAFKI